MSIVVVVIFFDTSALVRRYDRTEAGAARVRGLCRRASGHSLMMSALTPVELASAINRKLRLGQIDRQQRDLVWQLFGRHRRDQNHVLALDEQTYRHAIRLLCAHSLRAYDAVQLAAALQAERLLGALGDFRFCTADQAQAQAAKAEGLDVELIV